MIDVQVQRCEHRAMYVIDFYAHNIQLSLFDNYFIALISTYLLLSGKPHKLSTTGCKYCSSFFYSGACSCVR